MSTQEQFKQFNQEWQDKRAKEQAAWEVRKAELEHPDINVEWQKAVIFSAAAQIAAKRGDYHGDMYGCVTCYHARTPEECCPEGQLIRAVRLLQSLGEDNLI